MMLRDVVVGVARLHFNFRAKCAHAENAGISGAYSNCPKFLQGDFARKFCDSLNPCAAHKD
jgi:hypothetical protein